MKTDLSTPSLASMMRTFLALISWPILLVGCALPSTAPPQAGPTMPVDRSPVAMESGALAKADPEDAGTVADDEPYSDEHTIHVSDIPPHPPSFDQYPVHARYRGPVAAPDVKGHSRSRLFRTVIRASAEQGPNFAGHYTLALWGCGTSCASVAIVDARSGKVFHPNNLRNFDIYNVAFEEFEPLGGPWIQFHLDSKLLVVTGGINENPARRGISYFLWEHERLRRIRFVHKP